MKVITTDKLGSPAEDLFIELFCDRFGPDKYKYIFIQYHFVEIYDNSKFVDFVLKGWQLKWAYK